jgi:hypothetical protein
LIRQHLDLKLGHTAKGSYVDQTNLLEVLCRGPKSRNLLKALQAKLLG